MSRQVLIDGRDSPYITHRAQTESVTFLGNHSENTRWHSSSVLKYQFFYNLLICWSTNRTRRIFSLAINSWHSLLLFKKDNCSRNLYAIPGLDYVAHEDILPYTTSEGNPLQHELFDKFLMYQEGRDPPYVAQVNEHKIDQTKDEKKGIKRSKIWELHFSSSDDRITSYKLSFLSVKCSILFLFFTDRLTRKLSYS